MKHRVWRSMVVTALGLAIAAARAQTFVIIDLSGGPGAGSYPLTCMESAPCGGWTDEYRTCKLVLRRIPAGTFLMGSPANEYGRYSDEKRHPVTLTRDFYVGIFEVTQRQWELVMGTRPSYFDNPSCYACRPVECVTYNDIRGASSGAGWPYTTDVDDTCFLGRLRAKTGLDSLDLPTEAQWEYACRAGSCVGLNNNRNVSTLCGGVDGASTTLAKRGVDLAMDEVGRYWYNGGSVARSDCDTCAGTAKVGSYRPNGWGLYDMHGNVWEWCRDWNSVYAKAVVDPVGGTNGPSRCKRGGSWFYAARFCRSANRSRVWPNATDNGLGFRLAADCAGRLSDPISVPSEQEADPVAYGPGCVLVTVNPPAWPWEWPPTCDLAKVCVRWPGCVPEPAVLMQYNCQDTITVQCCGPNGLQRHLPTCISCAWAAIPISCMPPPLLDICCEDGVVKVRTTCAGLRIVGDEMPVNALPATWRLMAAP